MARRIAAPAAASDHDRWRSRFVGSLQRMYGGEIADLAGELIDDDVASHGEPDELGRALLESTVPLLAANILRVPLAGHADQRKEGSR